MEWHSYPQIFALGHRYIEELLLDPVVVQEKVDGSQLSFGHLNGQLVVRSKAAVVDVANPQMFNHGVNTILSLPLRENWIYRGEYLQKPKHNVLAYERIPKGNIVLFDINKGNEDYLPYGEVQEEASRLGIECVPLLYSGAIHQVEQVYSLLETVSFLGGPLIEGIVIKNYTRFGRDKKALMGKYVSEKFKESHKKHWKVTTKEDSLAAIVASLKTEARWRKAIQHLKESGRLTNAPQDIGPLIKEVQQDILKEETDWIKEKLFDVSVGHVLKGVTVGLPEWYKQELLQGQFQKES